jgi:hypothetical protein
MVCEALAATVELDPELQAAAPATSATAPTLTVTARRRAVLLLLICCHLTTVSNWGIQNGSG